MRRVALIIVALLTGAAMQPAVAQEDRDRRLRELEQQLRESEQQMRQLREQMNELRGTDRGLRWRMFESEPFVSVFTNRARLGVTVRTFAEDDDDRTGALIESVQDDSPADEAGLEPGDVVTHWNGESLTEARSSNDRWSAGSRLVDLARELEEGDSVVLRYQRDGRERTATVVARVLEPSFVFGDEPMIAPRVEVLPPSRLRIEPDDFISIFIRGRWNDLELVTIDDDLGSYFGTTEGLLVVKATEESPLDLKSGDVILTIGGRAPSSPTHALRILRNYESGETVTVELLRKQRRMTVSGEIPEDSNEMRQRVLVRPSRQSSF